MQAVDRLQTTLNIQKTLSMFVNDKKIRLYIGKKRIDKVLDFVNIFF